MSIDAEINKAEQYFPTYKAAERDILLLEFEEANKIANNQAKVFGQMASVLLAATTVLIPLFLDNENERSGFILNAIKANSIMISVILFAFGFLLLRYFVDLQKQITINARKVVTLRVMLGLDYGSIHLTLPNWRVEGATNPFAIKYFYGWLKFRSSPFWILTIGVNIIWWLSNHDKTSFNLFDLIFIPRYWGNILITVTYLHVFRTNLNDRHETNYLNIIKFISTYLLRVKVVPDFEYVLYRSKLAYIELDRLEVDYKNMKKMIVSIEDKSFYQNHGVSYKALVRSFFSRFKYMRRKKGFIESGGSTITMQLSRTLFIKPTPNKYRRKIVEILLSYWINRQFSKDEILKIYLSSVRFERKVIGLANAIKFFFETPIRGKKLTMDECFFLSERLSNITSTVNKERVKYLSQSIKEINQSDLMNLYSKQILSGKLTEQVNTS